MLDSVLEIAVTYSLRLIIVRNYWHTMPVTNNLKQGTSNIKVINIIDTEYYSEIQYISQCHTGRGYHIGISAIPTYPDSKVHGANMGPTWVLSAPCGHHAGPRDIHQIRQIHQCSMEILMWNMRLPYEIYHSGIPTDSIDMCNRIWRSYSICIWLLGLLDWPQIFHCTRSSTRSRSG